MAIKRQTWRFTVLKYLYSRNKACFFIIGKMFSFGKCGVFVSILLKDKRGLADKLTKWNPTDFSVSEIAYMSNIIKGKYFDHDEFMNFHKLFGSWVLTYYEDEINALVSTSGLLNGRISLEIINYRGMASLFLAKIVSGENMIFLKLTMSDTYNSQLEGKIIDQGIPVPKLNGKYIAQGIIFYFFEFVDADNFGLETFGDLQDIVRLSKKLSLIDYKSVLMHNNEALSNIFQIDNIEYQHRNVELYLSAFHQRKERFVKTMQSLPPCFNHGDFNNVNLLRRDDKIWVIDFSGGANFLRGYDISCYVFNNIELILRLTDLALPEVFNWLISELYDPVQLNEINKCDLCFLLFSIGINEGIGALLKENKLYKKYRVRSLDAYFDSLDIILCSENE